MGYKIGKMIGKTLDIFVIAIGIFMVLFYTVVFMLFITDKIYMSKGFIVVTIIFTIMYFAKELYRDLSELR